MAHRRTLRAVHEMRAVDRGPVEPRAVPVLVEDHVVAGHPPVFALPHRVAHGLIELRLRERVGDGDPVVVGLEPADHVYGQAQVVDVLGRVAVDQEPVLLDSQLPREAADLMHLLYSGAFLHGVEDPLTPRLNAIEDLSAPDVSEALEDFPVHEVDAAQAFERNLRVGSFDRVCELQELLPVDREDVIREADHVGLVALLEFEHLADDVLRASMAVLLAEDGLATPCASEGAPAGRHHGGLAGSVESARRLSVRGPVHEIAGRVRYGVQVLHVGAVRSVDEGIVLHDGEALDFVQIPRPQAGEVTSQLDAGDLALPARDSIHVAALEVDVGRGRRIGPSRHDGDAACLGHVRHLQRDVSGDDGRIKANGAGSHCI